MLHRANGNAYVGKMRLFQFACHRNSPWLAAGWNGTGPVRHSCAMRVPVEQLRSLVNDIFAAGGCSATESATIAKHLIASDLAGHPSHGVVRARNYIEWLAGGAVFADREVAIISENDTLAVLDGRYGFGQTLGESAVAYGLAKAKATGVSVVALRNSGHLGRIADWAEIAADAGYISIHFVNVAGSGLVAPFGGKERRFGTDPIAIGIPQEDRPPILIDFATSVVAEGKAKVALNGGKPVPDNALIGPDGVVSGDTSVLYGDVPEGKNPDPRRGAGALRTMGEQKGSALALACSSWQACSLARQRVASNRSQTECSPSIFRRNISRQQVLPLRPPSLPTMCAPPRPPTRISPYNFPVT